jgi:hypothetical protein
VEFLMALASGLVPELHVFACGFDPLVKIGGRYYGFPSTDKQNIDLNVNAVTNC